MLCYQALIFMCLYGNLVLRETTFALFLDGNHLTGSCDQSSTLQGYGILVSHSQPSHDSGAVVIKSALNHSLDIFADPNCIWTYRVQHTPITKEDRVERGSNISWQFSKSGLHKVSVTARFDKLGIQRKIKNCTFVNVTDCSFTSKVMVSTATGSYNISQNHTDIILNFPGLVNFTVSTHISNDPYFVCNRLYFIWWFEDGRITPGKHAEHRYNSTGVFRVVLKIYKVFGDDNEKELIRNITMKVIIKDCSFTSKVIVSTATGSYNISQNHTDVILNSPGPVNFTVSTHFLNDPYFVCNRLYFIWWFEDGRITPGKHAEHRYNSTGVFRVVLKIYKVFGDDNEKEFIRNITMKIDVKGKHAPNESKNTVVDVSLVLAIFFVCFVFVICIAAYWFRRRLHRHTEVARFDFRGSEFQSDFDEPWTGTSCRGKGIMCRRGSNEYLLNFEQHGKYSSCRKFDGNNPNERL